VTTELKRLGKQGSYRLGRLRTQGIKADTPPPPFRPTFARDVRRGPAWAWGLLLLAGAAVIAGAALAGWWFMPFAGGLAAGLANRMAGRRTHVALSAAAAMAVAGWAAPLAWHARAGLPYGPAARVVASIGRLPGSAFAVVAATLLVAVAQAVAGYWLGRAVTPRPADE
jgi:hypothetical protein